MPDRMGAEESLTDDAELEDLDEQPGFGLRELDSSLLSNPVLVRAVGEIAVASLVLFWPDRTDRILAILIGVAVLIVSSTALWGLIRQRSRRLAEILPALAGLVAAVWLLVSPNQSEVVLARYVGAAVLLVAARDLMLLWRGGHRDSRGWVLSRSVALVGMGTLLIAFPAEVFVAVTVITALTWIAFSLVVVVVCLDERTTGVAEHSDSLRLVADWLTERSKSVDDRQALYDKILYEGPNTRRRVGRFFALMGFASVIAAMGVVTDSTAVVIGAMLIAPLMTPLMGMAISLVMGWPRRLGRSALVACGGIGLAIVLGVLLGLTVPAVIDTATNSQIVARSSPTSLDLITALAAGAAGAYGLSRPDVSDSLPGVAIAISLVPPLSVVGIAYSAGDWASGNGALLLFATNALAILVMGGVTFVVTGVTPVQRVAQHQHRVRTAVAGVAGLGALVVGALFLNGAEIASDLVEQSSAEESVLEWLDSYPNHSFFQVDVDGDVITATIVGPTEGAPTAASLADALGDALDRTVTADLRLIVQERDTATSEN